MEYDILLLTTARSGWMAHEGQAVKVTGDQPLQVGQHSSSALPAETGAEFCGITSFLLRGRGRDHFVTLAVVASGLGTDAQAHRSSQLAGMVLRRHFSQSDSADMLELLSDALEQANRLIYERRFGFLRAGGTPGATLAAAVVFDTKLYAVSVGDCRVFLQRQNGPLIQITPIRSADVGRRAGTVSITDSPFPETFLGRAPTLSLDLRLNLSQGGSDRDMIGNQGAELEPGDTLLLLTRGIPQTLSLDRIESTLKRFPPDRAAERLADAAVSGQGAPSASALVLRVPGGSTPTGVWWRRPAVGRGLMVILALLAVSGTLYATRGSLPFFTSAAPTNTLTATATATPTPVPSATPAASRTPSPIPTVSATNTVTPSPTETVTASPTATASHTPTPTQSPTATSTPTLTPTPTPTHPRWRTLTPSTTPSSTWTATVTLAPPPPPPPPPPPTSTSAPPLTNTPVPTPTDTPVPPPTDTPIPTPTYTREIPIPEN